MLIDSANMHYDNITAVLEFFLCIQNNALVMVPSMTAVVEDALVGMAGYLTVVVFERNGDQ